VTGTITVVGAAGFIGRHIIDAFAVRGIRVLALTRDDLPSPPEGVKVVTGEFEQPEDYRPWLAGSQAVIHAASMSTPGSTAGHPLAEVRENLAPTLALLEALQEAPHCRLVYLSSGGTLYGDTGRESASEHSPLRPRSYHGAGKAAAEQFIGAWGAQFGGTAVVLRPANLYGPGQGPRSDFGIIPAAFDSLLRNEPLVIWGDGHSLRDYLYIEDFIGLCVSAALAPPSPGTEIVNAGSGMAISLNTLLDLIEATTGRRVERRYEKGRAVDVPHVALDIAKAVRLYGWRPTVPLAEGLARTWQWFRSRQR
jgi:UDP-glucose 4-epimerase